MGSSVACMTGPIKAVYNCSVCPPFQEFRVNRQRHSTNHELRVVFCYAAVRLFFAKREAAASGLPPSAATRLKTKANAEPILFATPPPRARTQTKRSSSARKQASRIARASERKAEAAAEDEAFIAAAAEVEPVQLFRGSKAEATPETTSKSAAVQTQTRKLKELRLPANLALDQPNCTARARNPRKLKPRVLQNLQRSRVSSRKRQRSGGGGKRLAGISERKPSSSGSNTHGQQSIGSQEDEHDAANGAKDGIIASSCSAAAARWPGRE